MRVILHNGAAAIQNNLRLVVDFKQAAGDYFRLIRCLR